MISEKGDTALKKSNGKNRSEYSPKKEFCANAEISDGEFTGGQSYDEALNSVTSTMKAVGAKTLTDGENVSDKSKKGVTDRFADFVRKGTKHSFAAKVLTSYNESDTSERRAERTENRSFVGKLFYKLSRSFSKGVTDSFLISSFRKAADKILTLRLKVFGAFFATFGIYVFAYYLLENFFMTEKRDVIDVFFGLSLMLLSIPLLLSTETLSSALCNSSFGRTLKNVVGLHTVSISRSGVTGRANFGFAAGVLASLLAMVTSPSKVILLLAAAVFVWTVLLKPEFGVVATAFLIPFADGNAMITCIAICTLAFALKLIGRKRFISFEMLDISVAAVLVTVALGFVGSSVSGAGGRSAFLAVMLIPYFLTVNLMKNRLWLERATCAFVFGVSTLSGIYLLATFADVAFGGISEAIADILPLSVLSASLGGESGGAALLCVAALPMAVSLLMSPSVKAGKFHSLVSVSLILICIIKENLPGTVVAVAVSLLVLMLVYSKKAVFIPIFAAIALPTVSFVFPNFFEKVSSYFTFGVELTGASYLRFAEETLLPLSKKLMGGIGIGASADGAVQSTYWNILTETGAVGLAIFVLFIILFVCSSFKVIEKTDNSKKSPALVSCGVRINTPDSLGTYKSSKKGSVNQALTLSQYCISRKIGIAAPFCSVLSLLICALCNDIFDDGKTFLAFWIAAGICAAYVRTTRRDINDIETSYNGGINPVTFSQIDIEIG